MTNLGFLYEKGHGVPKDLAKACQWYSQAAERGYAKAQNNLGALYYTGQGVQKDPSVAASWYRRAAAQGNASALNNLGICYEDGHGVARDLSEASRCYREAADLGNMHAQTNAGFVYMVLENYEEAARYFRKALDQGSADAAHNLGALLENGLGEPKSLPGAEALYAKAAAQGLANSQEALTRVREALEEEQAKGKNVEELRAKLAAEQAKVAQLEQKLAATKLELDSSKNENRVLLQRGGSGVPDAAGLPLPPPPPGGRARAATVGAGVGSGGVMSPVPTFSRSGSAISTSSAASSLVGSPQPGTSKLAAMQASGVVTSTRLLMTAQKVNSGKQKKSDLAKEIESYKELVKQLRRENTKESWRLSKQLEAANHSACHFQSLATTLGDVVKNLYARTLDLEDQIRSAGMEPAAAMHSITEIGGVAVTTVIDEDTVKSSHGVFGTPGMLAIANTGAAERAEVRSEIEEVGKELSEADKHKETISSWAQRYRQGRSQTANDR